MIKTFFALSYRMQKKYIKREKEKRVTKENATNCFPHIAILTDLIRLLACLVWHSSGADMKMSPKRMKLNQFNLLSDMPNRVM